jgi:hypothetical protein
MAGREPGLHVKHGYETAPASPRQDLGGVDVEHRETAADETTSRGKCSCRARQRRPQGSGGGLRQPRVTVRLRQLLGLGLTVV